MYNKILKLFGTRNLTILIILFILNIFFSAFYINVATNFFNDSIVYNYDINEVLLQFIYSALIGGYIFIYIFFFLNIVKLFKLKNRMSFLFFNINIYLVIYIALLFLYFFEYISLSFINIYFSLLPIIGFFFLIFQLKEENNNSGINEGLIQNIDNKFGNNYNSEPIKHIPNDNNSENMLDKFNFAENQKINPDDNLDKFDTFNSQNDNKQKNKYFGKVKNFLGSLFKGEDNQYNNSQDNNFIDNSLNNDDGFEYNKDFDNFDIGKDFANGNDVKEQNNDNLDLGLKDHYINQNNGGSDINVDDLINDLDNEERIKEVLDIGVEDEYEMDENNYFKIDDFDDFDDDFDNNGANNLNITENTLVQNINDKIETIEETDLSKYYINGFTINKAQDFEKVEALLNEL